MIGLLVRRWNIFTYYFFRLTCFTIGTQILLLYFREILYEPTITAFLLMIRFYIYFENGVIRNE